MDNLNIECNEFETPRNSFYKTTDPSIQLSPKKTIKKAEITHIFPKELDFENPPRKNS